MAVVLQGTFAGDNKNASVTQTGNGNEGRITQSGGAGNTATTVQNP